MNYKKYIKSITVLFESNHLREKHDNRTNEIRKNYTLTLNIEKHL